MPQIEPKNEERKVQPESQACPYGNFFIKAVEPEATTRRGSHGTIGICLDFFQEPGIACINEKGPVNESCQFAAVFDIEF